MLKSERQRKIIRERFVCTAVSVSGRSTSVSIYCTPLTLRLLLHYHSRRPLLLLCSSRQYMAVSAQGKRSAASALCFLQLKFVGSMRKVESPRCIDFFDISSGTTWKPSDQLETACSFDQKSGYSNHVSREFHISSIQNAKTVTKNSVYLIHFAFDSTVQVLRFASTTYLKYGGDSSLHVICVRLQLDWQRSGRFHNGCCIVSYQESNHRM